MEELVGPFGHRDLRMDLRDLDHRSHCECALTIVREEFVEPFRSLTAVLEIACSLGDVKFESKSYRRR